MGARSRSTGPDTERFPMRALRNMEYSTHTLPTCVDGPGTCRRYCRPPSVCSLASPLANRDSRRRQRSRLLAVCSQQFGGLCACQRYTRVSHGSGPSTTSRASCSCTTVPGLVRPSAGSRYRIHVPGRELLCFAGVGNMLRPSHGRRTIIILPLVHKTIAASIFYTIYRT